MKEANDLKHKAGRGAQSNPGNRFSSQQYEVEEEYREYLHRHDLDPSLEEKTTFLKVYPKSIVNQVNSPDIGHAWSMNPYQGCEHGCSYCYARNSHEYWGYSAGSEFEQKIMVKENAALLLEQQLQKASWQPEAIMLSGNTDCYQPIERKLQITRSLLKVLQRYKHPVGIITKNALIQRDIDILAPMAREGLVHVNISITSLDEELRRKLEPRTASAKKRLQTVEMLAANNIPVKVMIAPVIPGLNSHEVFDIAKASAAAGALGINYTMVRLNGQIATIFMDWLHYHYPDRAQKVKKLIEETHGGQLNDSRFGRRMRGEGQVAEQLNSMIRLARKKYFNGKVVPPYDCSKFIRAPKGQLGLF